MAVIDASVVVGLLTEGLDPGVADREFSAPHLIDSEVTHALRRMGTNGQLDSSAADAAFAGFRELVIRRWPATHLLERMWELRGHLSGYDATYVALAESLDEPLITADRRLSRAPGLRCTIRVV